MDIAEFNALHMPALERNEVRHNLLLGLMSPPSPNPADETRRWTLGGAGACAIQTNGNRSIILGELDERQCHALAVQNVSVRPALPRCFPASVLLCFLLSCLDPNPEHAVAANSLFHEVQNVCGWIGVQVLPVNAEIAESLGMPEPYGAMFGEPAPNSPAARAGIQQYDVVTKINGSTLSRASDFAPIISALAPGTTVYLDTWRNRQPMEVKLVVELWAMRLILAGLEDQRTLVVEDNVLIALDIEAVISAHRGEGVLVPFANDAFFGQ